MGDINENLLFFVPLHIFTRLTNSRWICKIVVVSQTLKMLCWYSLAFYITRMLPANFSLPFILSRIMLLCFLSFSLLLPSHLSSLLPPLLRISASLPLTFFYHVFFTYPSLLSIFSLNFNPKFFKPKAIITIAIIICCVSICHAFFRF